MRLSTVLLLALIGVVLGVTVAHADDGPALKAPTPKEHAASEAGDVGTLEAGLGLPVGARVPSFTVKTAQGREMTATDLARRGPTLLVFYRGGWCPYCNFQVRELSLRYTDFRDAGVSLAVISADKPDGAAVVERAYEIPFPVLSDPDLAAHEAFNVVLRLDAEGVKRLESFGIDIEAWSGRKHHRIAVPGAFLVDRKGIVRWSHVARDYKTRPRADQLLKAVRAALPR